MDPILVAAAREWIRRRSAAHLPIHATEPEILAAAEALGVEAALPSRRSADEQKRMPDEHLLELAALIEHVAARPAREAAAALERKAEETRRAEAYAAVLAKVGLTHAEAAVLVEGAQHGGR